MAQLSEILDSVLAARGDSDPSSAFQEYVYRNLDVRWYQQAATRNEHLANPLNDELNGSRPRVDALTGAEEIYGDFLTLHHGSHDDTVLLLSHDTLSDLEAEILSDSGLLNPFILVIDTIVRGACQKYSVTFLHRGNRVTFNKDLQFAGGYGNGSATDMTPFVGREIHCEAEP